MAATRVIRRLEDLLDVDPTGIADGTVPVYNEVTEKHEYQTMGEAGGAGSLTDLTDVTGTPGPGKAPVADHTGTTYPLTEVATQAYVDEQVSEALGRWATLGEKLSFVDTLTGPWEASNPTVGLTPDGLTFGPYPDGAEAGGSIRYLGLNGQRFSTITNLAFNMRFWSDDKKPVGAPYLRVFTSDKDGALHDAIFSTSTQPFPGLGPGPFQEYVATAGMWRFDSDDGSDSEFGIGAPLSDLLAKYGDQRIEGIAITLGWTAGTNLDGLLRWVQLNGNRYTFGSV